MTNDDISVDQYSAALVTSNSAGLVTSTTALNGVLIDEGGITITLASFAGNPLTSDALPVTPPNLAQFENGLLGVTILPDSSTSLDTAVISAELTSLTLDSVEPCPVPEPALGSLLAAAALQLILLSKMKMRERSPIMPG